MMNLFVMYVVFVNLIIGEVVFLLLWVSECEVDVVIVFVVVGYCQWCQMLFVDCVDVLCCIGVVLCVCGEEVVQMIIFEMGKLIVQVCGEVVKLVNFCDWYVEYGLVMLVMEVILVENNQVVIEYCLLGVILVVMLWNFLVWQVMCGVVLILLVGNSYLLKYVLNVMGSVCLLGEIFVVVGLLDGVFGWVNVINDGVLQIINDDCIVVVIVIGSVCVGKVIGVQVGVVLKKCVFELGGFDFFIVFNDVDFDEVVKVVVIGCYQNSGQVCVVLKCFIFEVGIVEVFICKFVDVVVVLKMGDLCDE